VAKSNVTRLRLPPTVTIGDVLKSYDLPSSWWRRLLCRVTRRHRDASRLQVTNLVEFKGHRPQPLTVCRVCGAAWVGGKEVR
jgi:hypothetical protein